MREYEEKFLKLKFARNEIFTSDFSFSDIVNSVKNWDLPLLMTKDDGEKVLDDSSIQEIKKVIPCLLRIADNPRSFIKTIERKVPVETAKKINYKAISKLSRDCNDWHTRTILTVKPKRIAADVHEETINLYENRFVCSLINEISKQVDGTIRSYEGKQKEIVDNLITVEIDRMYGCYSEFYYNIYGKMYSDVDSSYKMIVEEELKSAKEIEKKIKLLKNSDLYKTLHKKEKVKDPIQKTNILMFDYDYNQAYKLWKYLKSKNKEERPELRIKSDETEMKAYYHLYSFIWILAMLDEMKFEEKTNNKICFDKDDLTIKIKPSENLIFQRDSNIIKINVTDEYIKCSLSYEDLQKNNQMQKVDDFYFYPDFTNFESRDINAGDKTKDLLDGLVVNEKFTNITSKYALVSVDMAVCSKEKPFSDKVYRRFYSMGNNFSPEEKQDNLDKWADYKTGISIISPMSEALKNNILNIKRIFNYHLIRNINFKETISVCPLCGGKNIKQSNHDNYTCPDCNHNISITYCNSCDPNHKKPILWVKYKDDKFLENEKLINDLPEMKIFNRLSRIEKIMEKNATTAFDFEKEPSGWKLKTICPYCGKKLGETK